MSDLGLACGVAAHSPDCLCDVIVTEPVAVNPNLRHGWFVKEVMDFGHHDTTTPEGLLAFLASWTEIHDQFVWQRDLGNTEGDARRGYEPWRRYSQTRIDEGVPSRLIINEVKEIYGVTLNPNMFKQLRFRHLQKVAA